MMSISPFKFGRVVTGSDFINREPEKLRIKNNILSLNNTIIISPRRWGKSSLVRKVAAEMGSDNIRFVLLDVYNIRTEEEFLTNYSREILRVAITRKEELLNSARDFFKRIIPIISFRLDPVNDISLKFNWEEVKDAIDEVINLPEKVAVKKGIRLVVCIDEFQNIARIKDFEKLEETLRSCWQHHNNVSYCLYGSRKHMMAEIFRDKSRPFYRFGDIIMLEKVPQEHWSEFISKGFEKTGKTIHGQLINKLIDMADNQPEYIQQLAHFTWSLTGEIVDEIILNEAAGMVLNSNSSFYQEVCDNLSMTQLNLIKAVMQGEIQFTAAEVMRRYNLGTPRNVSKNKEVLESKDIIDFSSDKASISDPFFRQWFGMKFALE
jgi:hypothetical protein